MDKTVQKHIQIKGVRDGLLMTLGTGEWQDLQIQLMEHISENEGFFKGAKVALEVGDQDLRAAELGSLRNLLSDREVTLWAVLSSSSVTEKNAQALGLATRLSIPRVERKIKNQDSLIDGEGAILVHRTLRSGHRITNQGHVIVIGDINPGAEIISGGSIVVWGKIKGMVHAGAEGNDTALICALQLLPMQLRIGELIAKPQLKQDKIYPEIARIENNQILIEPWDYKGDR